VSSSDEFWRGHGLLSMALHGESSITSAPLPLPTIRGDNLLIKITEEVYTIGLEKCKHHIHGRLFLNKGNKSYTAKEATAKLSKTLENKGSLGFDFPWSWILRI